MSNHLTNLAFVFPGQGSQSVGMLDALDAEFPEVKTTFDQASEILGRDLWEIVKVGPDELLNQTQNTQPAMLVAGVCLWQIWCKLSPVRPGWMAGHSLGEYTALVCAGTLGFADAVKLVEARANFMQAAVPTGIGAMAAILGLTDQQVIESCEKSAGSEIVSAVNFNSPGQIVIAGHATAVERAVAAAKEAGAKRAVLLPVSVPSHCALMQPAAEALENSMRNINFVSPNIPVIHNVDISSHVEPYNICKALTTQLYQPVRWVETVTALHHKGVTTFVECGPGKVLTGLGKRIVKEAQHLVIYDPETLNNTAEQLNG